jgi:hypothetical protein
MGITSGGLPYPEPTDPIADGAAAIRALAEAIDATRQTGSVVASGVSPNTGAYTVTFPKPYSAAPNIAVSILGGGPGTEWSVIVITRSATGFTGQVFRGGVPPNSGTATVMWIAQGVPA